MPEQRHLLMIPGPVEIDPAVMAAVPQWAVNHHDPDYIAVYDRALAHLHTVLGTAGQCVILPGSGRVGLEAAIASLTRPGDATLHLTNGFFGGWTPDMARRAGCNPTVLELPWEQPVDPAVLRQALAGGTYRLVTVVHCETSTGVVNPVAELGAICREAGTLLMVDGIAAAGCLPVAMDEMNIDVYGAASQKGLGALLGLSMVGLGARALQTLRRQTASSPCQSYALDLSRWEPFFGAPVPRPYPVVPSAHLVLGLAAALDAIAAEGLTARYRRHETMSLATRAAATAMGLELYPQGSPPGSLSVVRVPAGLAAADILRAIKERHGIEIGGGMGPLKGAVLRIAHMNCQADPKLLLPTLEALGQVLQSLGHNCNPAAATGAFRSALRPDPQ